MPFYLSPSSNLIQSPVIPLSSFNISLNLLSWNCRGTGGSLYSSKMRHLARLINSTKAMVSFIPEGKSNKYTSKDI